MAIFVQLGGWEDENLTIPVNQKISLSQMTATPPDAKHNSRAAHLIPTELNVPSREQMDFSEMAKAFPEFMNLTADEYIFTNWYAAEQAITRVFCKVDRAASATGFTFDIVKVPSAYDADGNVYKDYANETVIASDLSADSSGVVFWQRYLPANALNATMSPQVDNGIMEAVGGDIAIRIATLPANWDVCSQAPKLTLNVSVEEPCFRDFVIDKDRI